MKKKSISKALAFCFVALFSFCGTVFVNPDLAGGQKPDTLAQYTIEKLVVSTQIEQQIISQFRDTGVTQIPESDFFEWQDRVLNALLGVYQNNPTLEFPSETRGPVLRVDNLDNPRFSADHFYQFLQNKNIQLCTLSVTEPLVVRAVLRTGVPLLTYGQLHYKRKIPRSESNDSLFVEDKAVSLFRRHETFDLIYGYSRLLGPQSRLPGEAGPKFLYTMRSSFDFSSFEGEPLKDHSLTIYGKGNQSRWIFSNILIPVASREAIGDLTDRINAEAARERYNGAPIKLLQVKY